VLVGCVPVHLTSATGSRTSDVGQRASAIALSDRAHRAERRIWSGDGGPALIAEASICSPSPSRSPALSGASAMAEYAFALYARAAPPPSEFAMVTWIERTYHRRQQMRSAD
jgi:hypothetical protein